MAKRRSVFRKIERTPEELAELKVVRERFQRERPTPDELVAGGEYYPAVNHGDVLDLMKTLSHFKLLRQRTGMSLAQLSKKTGIDKAAISRLENGVASNPTLLTLLSLANGLGKRVVVKLVDAPAAKPKRRRTG